MLCRKEIFSGTATTEATEIDDEFTGTQTVTEHYPWLDYTDSSDYPWLDYTVIPDDDYTVEHRISTSIPSNSVNASSNVDSNVLSNGQLV